jgi:hypothetical protein
VGVVVFDHVHRGLFGASRSAVDTGVARDKIGLFVRVRSLVLGDRPAGPGIGAVVEQEPVEVLIGLVGVLVVFGQVVVEVQSSIRLLFCEQLIQGFTRLCSSAVEPNFMAADQRSGGATPRSRGRFPGPRSGSRTDLAPSSPLGQRTHGGSRQAFSSPPRTHLATRQAPTNAAQRRTWSAVSMGVHAS